jgi:HK97 family phage major capsid protein
VTKLQAVGVTPGWWVVHPTDWQAVELAKNLEGNYLINQGGPVDLAGRRLWSTPVVVSASVDAGSALLVGDNAVELSTDRAVSLRWSESADDFEKNLLRARLEGRFATDVLRPFGCVLVDLTA